MYLDCLMAGLCLGLGCGLYSPCAAPSHPAGCTEYDALSSSPKGEKEAEVCSCYTSALATIIKVAAVTVGSAFSSRHNRCFRSTAIRPSMVLLYWALFLPGSRAGVMEHYGYDNATMTDGILAAEVRAQPVDGRLVML